MKFRVTFVLVLAGYFHLGSAFVRGQTLWSEDAESGSTYVLDHTSPSYSLIQSNVVGQGEYAFRLANPGLADNWFEIDRTIDIQADTKLFFLSRLGWSYEGGQFARVQLSTNNGATWPIEVYTQTGMSGPGEGAFSLRESDLSAYANQSVRMRFYYDYLPGQPGFNQIDPGVGWYIDDIQIGSALQKSQWSIGNPSSHEQQYLEYINRARVDAIVEASRLGGETNPDITSAYASFGITGQDIVDQFQWYVSNGHLDRHAQPLSFNAALLTAAQLHTQDMFDHQFQGHFSSSNPPAPFQANATLGQRLDAVGYSGGAGENVFSYADSVAHGHAGFDVDWGNTTNAASPAYNPAFAGQGMQNPAGHRINLHNGDFSEIGIGVINGTNGSVGPQLVTQDFGNPGTVRYITGAVYEDLNGNSFYDIGEGRSGVRIDVDGSAYFAISTDSGGYSVPVSEDGDYAVSFTGGSFATYLTNATVLNGQNVKIDYLVAAATLDGDHNNDGFVNAADYALWRDSMSDDFAAYGKWRDNFGATQGAGASQPAAVPEPNSLLFVVVCFAALTAVSRRTKSHSETAAR